MATSFQRISRQIASPSGLLLAFLLFSLPWVDVQCTSPSHTPARKLAVQYGIESVYDQLVRSGETVISQSGLEAAFGVCSVYRESCSRACEAENELSAQMDASPLLFAFPVMLLIGIAVGFLLYPGAIRSATIALISSTALLLLTVQFDIGFPLSRWYREECRREAGEAEPVQQSPASPKAQESRPQGFDLRYTPWFSLTLFGLSGSLFFAWKEWRRCARKRHADIQDGSGHESPQSLKVDTSPR